ncbi:MAG: ABC transporter permease subunit [Malacoplasma sp.]|nr:ABC transporter permease subunit [Malacoplasma sp.]
MGLTKFRINKNSLGKFTLLIPYIVITLLLIVIPLILIFIKPFQESIDSSTNSKIPISENWSFLGQTIWEKIGLSILVAVIVTFVCVVLGYAFAYFLSLSKGMISRIVAISLMTSPMWVSFLVKIVSLKEVFDFINNAPNSTYGMGYTIIVLIYVNLPIFILTIYTFLNTIPKNLLEASKDLGKNSVQTFIYVILPLTKNAIVSGIILVFLPALTTAGVTQFIDNSNNGDLIGSALLDQGLQATSSQIALARVASLSLVICLLVLITWSFLVLIPKTVKFIKKNKMKKENLDAEIN